MFGDKEAQHSLRSNNVIDMDTLHIALDKHGPRETTTSTPFPDRHYYAAHGSARLTRIFAFGTWYAY
jgi:hypothetical protein